MKIQSKSPFSIFSDTINLLNPNKLTKVKKMNKWEQESVSKAQSKINEYPTFSKAPIVQAIDNLEEVKNVIENLSARVQRTLKEKAIRYNISYEQDIDWLKLFGQIERHERLLGLQAKADRYNISYDEESPDWVTMDARIERWEGLLRQAKEYNLKVDPKDYDPISLEDRIEEEISQNRKEMRDQNLDYYCARL